MAGTCTECGNPTSRANRTRCRLCANKSMEKFDWPSDEELLKLIEENGVRGAARKLGTSHNAVWLRQKKIKKTQA